MLKLKDQGLDEWWALTGLPNKIREPELHLNCTTIIRKKHDNLMTASYRHLNCATELLLVSWSGSIHRINNRH